jgi:hypothetical protein
MEMTTQRATELKKIRERLSPKLIDRLLFAGGFSDLEAAYLTGNAEIVTVKKPQKAATPKKSKYAGIPCQYLNFRRKPKPQIDSLVKWAIQWATEKQLLALYRHPSLTSKEKDLISDCVLNKVRIQLT